MHRVSGLTIAALVLATAACTGGDDDPGESADDGASAPSEVSEPTALVPVVERVAAEGGSALVAGPGDARLEVTGVASNGDVVLVTGERVGENTTDREPALVRSSDGRAWESIDLGSALTGDGLLSGVVAAGGAFVAIGQESRGGGSVALRSDDGARVESAPLPFPEPEGDASPYAAVAAATAGETVFVLGVSLDIPEGTSVRFEDIDAAVALLASDDAGQSWAPASLPDAVAEIESSGVFDDVPGGGVGGSSLALVEHGGELVLAVSLPGPEGSRPITTLWRSSEQVTEWVELGTTDDLLGGEPVDVLHSYGGSLLAFTNDGGDASLWRSEDDGASFERLDVDAAVLGGSGSQAVDAAVTLENGALVAAGRTSGEGSSRQQPSELELWVTQDLEEWERPLTDVALAGAGAHQASGLVALGDEVVVVGTHEREATDEEVSDFEDSIGQGVPPPPLARDGAAWIVSLEEQPVVAAPAQVAPIRVTGIDGDVTVNDMISYSGGLLAAGSVGGDEAQAAIWRSSDGQSWEQVSSPALSEPAGQRVNALTTSGDGLVAVGQTVEGETAYLGAWTSADGRTWERSDLASPEFESARAYGVVETAGGLLAVGEYFRSDDDRFRDAGVWRSTDGGQSWSRVDTTGAPFRSRDVEVLFDVVVTPGGIVAAGHTGDAERTESGFTYSRHPYVVGSEDGEAWEATAAPYADLDFGEALALAVDQDDAVALGWFDRTADELPGEPRVFAAGVARRTTSGWSDHPESFRHEPYIDGSAPSPTGLVVTGRWFRGSAGVDPLIGVVDGDEITFLTDGGLIAEGDQHAVAVAPLGDRLVVLGLDTTEEDAPTVIGWEVTASPLPSGEQT